MIISGNVGVGTTAPIGSLDVSGALYTSTGILNLRSQDTNAEGGELALLPGGARSTTWRIDNYDNNLRFFNGGLVAATILPGGNVGIGSSAPTAALDVNGTIKGNTPAVAAYSETGQTTTTRNAWVTSTAVQVTVPVTGKYLVQASARAYVIGAADNWWKARVYNQTQGTQACVFLGFGYAGSGGFSKGDGTASQTTIASFNAGDVVVLQFSINGSDTGSVYLVGDGNGGSSLSLLRVSN